MYCCIGNQGINKQSECLIYTEGPIHLDRTTASCSSLDRATTSSSCVSFPLDRGRGMLSINIEQNHTEQPLQVVKTGDSDNSSDTDEESGMSEIGNTPFLL